MAMPHDCPRGADPCPGPTALNRHVQLLEIAKEIIGRKGYRNTLLRDIAARAHVTNAALHYHFARKDALYREVQEHLLRRLLTSATRAAAAEQGAARRARAVVMSAWRTTGAATLDLLWGEPDADEAPALAQIRARCIGLLRDRLQEGMDTGEFRPVDAGLAARLLLSLTDQPGAESGAADQRPAEALIEQSLCLVLDGLAAHRQPPGAPT